MNRKKIVKKVDVFYIFLVLLFIACLYLKAWLAAGVVFIPGLLYYSITSSDPEEEEGNPPRKKNN